MAVRLHLDLEHHWPVHPVLTRRGQGSSPWRSTTRFKLNWMSTGLLHRRFEVRPLWNALPHPVMFLSVTVRAEQHALGDLGPQHVDVGRQSLGDAEQLGARIDVMEGQDARLGVSTSDARSSGFFDK